MGIITVILFAVLIVILEGAILFIIAREDWKTKDRDKFIDDLIKKERKYQTKKPENTQL
jgi:hypothetical protein